VPGHARHSAFASSPGFVVQRAVAARRRELDITQRSLASDKVINTGTLIAFEKGA
jgi:DNA-binding XRE family transcriptional regulator